MSATVTLPLEELDIMRKASEEKDVQITQLKQDLLESKMTDSAGSVAPMSKLCRYAMEIVTFAVGNLSPEIIKRWPYQALREVAARLALMPDYSVNDRDLANELLKFAAECERWEAKRKVEPEKYVPPPPGFDEHGRPVDNEGKVIPGINWPPRLSSPGETSMPGGSSPIVGTAKIDESKIESSNTTPDDPQAA